MYSPYCIAISFVTAIITAFRELHLMSVLLETRSLLHWDSPYYKAGTLAAILLSSITCTACLNCLNHRDGEVPAAVQSKPNDAAEERDLRQEAC